MRPFFTGSKRIRFNPNFKAAERGLTQYFVAQGGCGAFVAFLPDGG